MTARRINFVALFGFVLAIGLYGVIAAQDDKDKEKEIAWFDMDHCEICKNFGSMKKSIHRIKWENHLLDDGMISVSIVPDDMKEDMEKVKAGIQGTVAKLEQGGQMDMCGHCQVMGKMMMQGANFKEFNSLGVDISIVTSSEPDVVKEIHDFAKKSKTEYEKMLKKIKAEQDN